MPYDEHVSRREFLGRLGAGALLGATALRCNSALGATGAWTPPPVLKNPNILMIMVDQMRPPMWMNSTQSGMLTQVLPNIMGRIQSNSYNFGQYFVAATVCTPSRSALLTGLYSPQTAMYATSSFGANAVPMLNPAFPTWGKALAVLNPAYQGNIYWFGKWHLSQHLVANPLAQYGFGTGNYPGGTNGNFNPSPDGTANEGTDGGLFGSNVWANDSMIAGDFIGWLQGLSGPSSAPWCATVSLVNPHDITYAPAWLVANPFPPQGVPTLPVYFPPPTTTPPSFYSAQPSPWNFETLASLPNKPALQLAFSNYINQRNGSVADWGVFLNQYFWLQGYADTQVGRVLDALKSSPFANNTIIIFLSDHGEYGGSHGMHTKGFAVYDESIRVPFYVQFPGQTGSIAMNQMCSAVDVFGLICDLATGGSGQWAMAYPDLANRQSMWSFLYNNSSETRVAPDPIGLPYIVHTCDEGAGGFQKPHITCIRSKLDLNAGAVGAKLAFYTNWAACSVLPDSTIPDPEFYNYASNTYETGNDYYNNDSATQTALANHEQVLGSWGTPSTGVIGSELAAPLIGTGTDGNPLSQAQATAQQTYLAFLNGSGGCSD